VGDYYISYTGSVNRMIVVKASLGIKAKRYYLKNYIINMFGGMVPVVQCLPGMCKYLYSNPML
jgi:hypothetical protein